MAVSVTRAPAVVEDPRYLEHTGPRGHPERPERLVAVGEAIAERAASLSRLAVRPAEDDEILRVHGPGLLARVAEAARRAPAHLDPDTYVSSRSLEVARLAAGATLDLARAVVRGSARGGLAAVRPPGHHAEAGRSMGFCLFNNVAIAARALQAEEDVERILIVDWDVHHGNGTQEVFEDDPSVLYFSTHQWPYYPGTGDFGEIGRGRGEGATVNVPLPAGCGDDEYVGVFQRVLVPVAHDFRPELILVSCGFDAHADDPLASMDVSERGFRDLATIVRALGDTLCEGRVAFVLEGGYAASGLREGTRAVLDVILAEQTPPPPPSVEAPAGSVLHRLVERAAAVHGRRHRRLGVA
jgi:acetoin utilization deacetylase AcuC-like enzyme